jgi:hypothetical protein
MRPVSNYNVPTRQCHRFKPVQVKGSNIKPRTQGGHRKPLLKFAEDEDGYPVLPEPRDDEESLGSQKEMIRSFMTLTYSKWRYVTMDR